jgi:hypothetical protein
MSESSHFKTHLIFYAIAVSTVLGLFHLTSSYGEAYLKAPPNLNGRYITNAAFPGCPEESRLVIEIQQSGLYLNAALELTTATAAELLPEQLTLSGDWEEQIKLAGATGALATCPNFANGAPASIQVPIQIQAAHQPSIASAPATLTGQITLTSANQIQPWAFTATQQAKAEKKQEH